MKIILATSNKGKVKEIKELLKDYEIFSMDEIIKPFEIVEDGLSFQENALIKAKAVFNALPSKKEFIVLADDSGISLPILSNKPGISSARYAGINTKDTENLDKLINILKAKKITSTPAFYTAAIALVSKFGDFCVHGWMHGMAIDEKRGNNGFGYDPIFIPKGYNETLGQMQSKEKLKISHRTKALNLAKILINKFNKES